MSLQNTPSLSFALTCALRVSPYNVLLEQGYPLRRYIHKTGPLSPAMAGERSRLQIEALNFPKLR